MAEGVEHVFQGAVKIGEFSGAIESFTNPAGANPRPDPDSVPVGTIIYNTDDNAPNYSDGTNWRDATGTLT